MAKIEMKVRLLKTGETMVATLDSFEDTVIWLGERPEFTEVLGVLSEDLSQSQHRALKAACRPYSAAEQALIAEGERQVVEAIKKQMQSEMELSKKREREHREAMAKADPNRPMLLRWHHEEGLSVADPYDPREITAAARSAVAAWIAERNTWVISRGQKVYEATMSVFPGEVPGGDEADRVERGGQFVPGLADPEGDA